jgi:hypothetical protein
VARCLGLSGNDPDADGLRITRADRLCVTGAGRLRVAVRIAVSVGCDVIHGTRPPKVGAAWSAQVEQLVRAPWACEAMQPSHPSTTPIARGGRRAEHGIGARVLKHAPRLLDRRGVPSGPTLM